MTADDEPFLRRVFAGTRDDIRQAPLDDATKKALMEQQFDAQHAFYQQHFSGASFDVILCDGQPAGRLYLDRRDDEMRIIDIAILPDYRGRGVGTFLMQRLMKEATALNLPIQIHVDHHNPALRLYERLGFELVGDNGLSFLMQWTAGDFSAC